jgi:hypothetical protein
VINDWNHVQNSPPSAELYAPARRMNAIFLVSLFLGLALLKAQSPGTFTATGDLISIDPAFTVATLLLNGKVLITGSSAQIYDPASRSFSLAGSTNSWQGTSSTLLADGRVLLAGGYLGDSSRTELYDPAAGTFTPTGNMTIPRVGHNAVLLANGKVFIVGGEAWVDGVRRTDIPAELYDPESGTFAATGSFAAAGPGTTSATLLADGKVLVLAYYTGLAGIYDPAIGGFRTVGPGPSSSTATLLANGKILFAGGTGDIGQRSYAFLYDPALGTFAGTGSMTAARLLQSATLLSDGTVLISGGQVLPGDGTGPALASAELYDPVAGTFSATGSMITARYGHPAQLLPDGTTLVGGGFGSSPPVPGDNPGALAELYHPAVVLSPPLLYSLPGNDQGQGAIWHSTTGEIASAGNPAVAGEALSMYTGNLIDGGVIPPQVIVAGRLTEILYFGAAPGYPRINQVNFRMSGGITPGIAVPVLLTYLGRASNEVTIGVQ